jgi:chromosome segregation ATPase
MTRSSRKTEETGDVDTEDDEAQDAQLELTVRTTQLEMLKQELGALKRELVRWQARAERAEKEAVKWKATADEWRAEYAKLSGRK